MDQKYRTVRVVDTTKGELKSQNELKHINTILFHQLLTPIVYQQTTNLPITLQHFRYHRKNPYSLENTSLTAGLIEHELQMLVQLKKCQHNQVLIMDGSDYQSKINEIFDKYTVVKGYNYRLQGNQSQGVLLSYQHILKQIQYEFKLGNGKYRPGFIGQILLSQCNFAHVYYNALLSYLSYSSLTRCPVLINCMEGKEMAVTVAFEEYDQQSRQLQAHRIKFKEIEDLLQIAEKNKGCRVVLFNMPLCFAKRFNRNLCSEEIVCLNHKDILSLIESFNFHIGFDLTKYAFEECAIHYIALLADKFPERVLFSSGLRLKTDLSSFGGDGYSIHGFSGQQSEVFQRINKIIKDKEIIHQVMFKNQLGLLDWKERVQQVQVVRMWTCCSCNLSQNVKIESFRKMGKQFCSIKCLKQYKF